MSCIRSQILLTQCANYLCMYNFSKIVIYTAYYIYKYKYKYKQIPYNLALPFNISLIDLFTKYKIDRKIVMQYFSNSQNFFGKTKPDKSPLTSHSRQINT